MWLVFFGIILMIGIILSGVEADLYNIDISEKNFDFKLIISLRLFYIIKIWIISFDRYGIKFLNKRICYKDIMTKNQLNELNIQSLDVLKDLNIKFNKSKFLLKIGLIDISLTNIAVVFLSSIFPYFIKNNLKKKNVQYKILPEYNKLHLNFKGNIRISIRFTTLLKFYFKNIKKEITHNKNKNYEVKESL